MNPTLVKELKRFALFILVVVVWSGVYFSINALTAGREPAVLSGALESHIPYVSWFVFFYFSTYLLGVMPYFLVRDLDQFKRVVFGALLIIFISAVIFLIYPVTHPRDFLVGNGFLSSWVHLLHKVDQPFNCFPSMHISMASLAALFCAQQGGLVRKLFFATWIVLIALSTLFIKQHYLVDIVSGAFLAVVVYYFVRK
ncbi:MAG: phosphatase PAP2 family protein [Pseudomonadota bacterium]